MKRKLQGLAVPVGILIIWEIVSVQGLFPKSILPTIADVVHSAVDMAESGTLIQDLSISIRRVMEGYLMAVVFGIMTGTVMGMSKTVHDLFMPTFTAIRQIPMIAWIPLVILWFGIGEMSKIMIVFLAAFFQIMMNTYSGIISADQRYIEVANMYRYSRGKMFAKIYLPSAIPQIFIGLRLGLGVSWMAVVAAELVAATSGIGYRLSYARSMMESAVVITCMVVIGIIGMIMDMILGKLTELAMPWTRV